jgi:alanine dehydrogenase
MQPVDYLLYRLYWNKYKILNDYTAAGAMIVATAEEVFAAADMIMKVKEPQAIERERLRGGQQVLFAYLHLAPDPEQTKDLLASGATCIAYKTVTDDHGGLPLLRCPRWPAGWPRRSARGRCKMPMAGAAC